MPGDGEVRRDDCPSVGWLCEKDGWTVVKIRSSWNLTVAAAAIAPSGWSSPIFLLAIGKRCLRPWLTIVLGAQPVDRYNLSA